jgi:chemotaxis protein MotB
LLPIAPENLDGEAVSGQEITLSWTDKSGIEDGFLIEQAGVDPARVGAVGYGEFRPLADNATAEGRARNRRIAIVVLPDEIAPADNGPVHSPPPTELPPATAAPTNAPATAAPTNAPVEATPIEPADRPPAPGGN